MTSCRNQNKILSRGSLEERPARLLLGAMPRVLAENPGDPPGDLLEIGELHVGQIADTVLAALLKTLRLVGVEPRFFVVGDQGPDEITVALGTSMRIRMTELDEVIPCSVEIRFLLHLVVAIDCTHIPATSAFARYAGTRLNRALDRLASSRWPWYSTSRFFSFLYFHSTPQGSKKEIKCFRDLPRFILLCSYPCHC